MAGRTHYSGVTLFSALPFINDGKLLAPAGTPRPILVQISKEVARILDLPDIKERLQGMGYVSAPSTPEEHDKILRAQIETLSKVVREAGLRPK